MEINGRVVGYENDEFNLDSISLNYIRLVLLCDYVSYFRLKL